MTETAGRDVPKTEPATPLAKRPSGHWQQFAGLMLLFVGAIAIFIGIIMPVYSDPGFGSAIPPTFNAAKWPTIWIGAGLVNLGFVLWVVGQILRALFFLPGRVVHEEEIWFGRG